MRTLLTGSTAAALLIGGTIAAGYVSPAMAETLKKVPVIGSVFETAGDYGLKTANKKGLTTAVNQEIQVSGGTFRVSEVLYDGNRLSVGFVYKSKDKLDIDKLFHHFSFGYNGKRSFSGMGLSGDPIDEHTFNGIFNLTPETKLPKEFTLNLFYTDKKASDNKEIKLDIPVKISSKKKVYTINKSKSAKDVTVTVKKVTFTDASTELIVETKHRDARDRFPSLQFMMIDDRGIIIQRLEQSGSSVRPDGNNVISHKLTFSPMKRIPRYVIVKPVDSSGVKVKLPIPYNKVKMDDLPTIEKPVILSQGKAGSLHINRVEFLPNKTVVHYQARGKEPFDHFHDLQLQDAAGKKYRPIKLPKVENPDTYSFVAEFTAWKKNEPLTFVTRELPLNIHRNDLAIKVPIQK
nr:DUF4179 domain-containing protein [Paenactinomyces guangxiensis]